MIIFALDMAYQAFHGRVLRCRPSWPSSASLEGIWCRYLHNTKCDSIIFTIRRARLAILEERPDAHRLKSLGYHCDYPIGGRGTHNVGRQRV